MHDDALFWIILVVEVSVPNTRGRKVIMGVKVSLVWEFCVVRQSPLNQMPLILGGYEVGQDHQA